MKRLSLILVSALLMGQALAAPRVEGFTDSFTVNMPATINGQSVGFGVWGKSQGSSGLEFQNQGCLTTTKGTQCHFNIFDKGDGFSDAGNTVVMLSAFPKPYVCRIVIYDGAYVSNATIASESCIPITVQPSLNQDSEYNYTINFADNH